MDPGYDVTRIAAGRRRYKGNGLFRRGTIIRSALDVLRKAQMPLTAREVTERMLAARGVPEPAVAMRGLIASVQTSLQNHTGKSVLRKSVKAFQCVGKSDDWDNRPCASVRLS